jgi:hypothetical protein
MQKITEYDPAFFKEKFRYDLKKKYDNTSPLQSLLHRPGEIHRLKIEIVESYRRNSPTEN